MVWDVLLNFSLFKSLNVPSFIQTILFERFYFLTFVSFLFGKSADTVLCQGLLTLLITKGKVLVPQHLCLFSQQLFHYQILIISELDILACTLTVIFLVIFFL